MTPRSVSTERVFFIILRCLVRVISRTALCSRDFLFKLVLEIFGNIPETSIFV
jgi:hypothetical protein